MDSPRSSVDHDQLDFPYRWYRHGWALGLRNLGLGRLLGMGPCGERFIHPLVDGDRLYPLCRRARAARNAQGLECRADHPDLHADDYWHFLGALWDYQLGARFRRRRFGDAAGRFHDRGGSWGRCS